MATIDPRARSARKFSSVGTLFVLVAAVTVGRALPARATDVTACGQVIAAGDTGVLVADLDCSTTSVGVLLLTGATLDLNGHTLTGGDATGAIVVGAAAADGSGRGRFTVRGPGSIGGTGRNRNTPTGTGACIQVNDGRASITSATGVVEVHGCIYGVLGSVGMDPDGRARLAMDHVDLHDIVFDGVAVAKLVASNVEVSHNGSQGLGAGATMVLTDVVVHDNPYGNGVFAAKSLKGRRVTAMRNYNGADAWRTLKLEDSVLTDNSSVGAEGGRVTLKNCTVTGSGQFDVVSQKRPHLANTTCGTSSDFNSISWHVCGNGSPSGAFLDDHAASN